jgi:hypothetical protein
MSDVFLEPKVPEEGPKFPAGNGKLKMEALRFMERRVLRGFTEEAENEFTTKHCALCGNSATSAFPELTDF